jgi:cephalosporin-C deacetylase
MEETLMAFFDMPLEQLQAYVPPRTEPDDFDAFWQETLADARAYPLNATFTPYDAGLKLLEVFDVTYNGYGGQPIKGWLIMPRERSGKLPCVVEYVGYGGGRNLPINYLVWGSVGCAHFIMDTRGQGSTWSVGDTPDPELEPGNPHFPGYMTRGVLNPRTYYYRRVFTDAVRAVEAARSHEAVDPSRVTVTGGSQGGGITLAVAGLVNDVSAAMVDVPFLCHYRVAVELIDSAPYNEIARYCQVHRGKIETVYSTLSYFDGLNFAARAKAPALFSVGLMDEICPPRTVYAAYNHYAGEKDIRIYTYNHHEGGGIDHLAEKVKYIRALWG